ncbi:MAG TPA: aspartyl/asparaginyl beta-hydroxylase domain-containing protein [Sphingomicrobium sp.]|nr:aspartyl/asparaginyl beta-hydroxylase domain-containing protein [Sphingomicrobium sp.]
MTQPVASLVEEADRAAAAGNLKRAEELLLQAGDSYPGDVSLWLKAAALQRATGRPQVALATVHRALAISPLDFTALLLRASLLERLKQPGAAAAWSHALAQKPEGDLPPHLKSVVSDAQVRIEQWTAEREARMKAAMGDAEQSADPQELQRLERFRNNVLRRTRPYHSEPTHFHFPGIAEREFYPRTAFPWLDELEAATDVIASEMEAVMAAERAELVPYVQYAEHLPLDQWKELNNNADWTAIHLLKNGERVEANARFCPQTLEILEKCRQPHIKGASPNAMFSLLAPNTAIPAHVGVNNTRLVCHLPLVIPEGCWFRVGAERRFWKRGEAFVFDDTIEHEALNPTDQLRVVFIFDVWQPDLSPVERQAITALIETDGVEGGGSSEEGTGAL